MSYALLGLSVVSIFIALDALGDALRSRPEHLALSAERLARRRGRR